MPIEDWINHKNESVNSQGNRTYTIKAAKRKQ